ncbi:MAG: beta strand repeat-containing protein [Methylophagaceae bacterium]
MADNIKISELAELTSGSLGDATIFPIVDGGSTRKATLLTLQSYLTDDLATDSDLSSQISTVNSTITGLTTTDISEGTNKYYTDAKVNSIIGGINSDAISEGSTNFYYTDAKVDARINSNGAITSSVQVDLTATTNYISGIKTRLNTENVVSSSNQISASAAASGFGTGGGGASIPDGTVSSSVQTIEHINAISVLSGSITSTDVSDFSTAASASAAAAGFGAGGGGGSTDYISNISVNNSTLTFTGAGSGFDGTINLAAGESDGGNLLTTNDVGNFVTTADYTDDSASFDTRINSAGGGGSSIPLGTVSASAQTITHINTVNVVSSSQQINGSLIDLSSLSTNFIAEGSVNKYFSSSLILPILNNLGVLSGSADGFSVGGTDIISSSQQISDFEFVLQTALNASASTLQTNIDLISSDGISANDVNIFLAKQRFTDDIEVTGSILLNNGAFSGSGAQLFGIPATAIDGLSSTTQLIDGDNNVQVDNILGITSTVGAGNFNVNLTEGTNLIVSGGYAIASSGSWFSGSGQGLTNIPASSIDGGVDGQKISSGSFSASIEDVTGNFRVHPPALFDSTISASGLITAPSIQVGTTGTPTLYSANNLNLSSSGTVVVTDSPFRLNPLIAAQTASVSITPGDMVFSDDDGDFFGYRIVNTTGSWYSLTAGNVEEISWDIIVGQPVGLISSSEQIASGGALISSSTQFLPNEAAAGTIYYEDSFDNISGSSDFVYAGDTRQLTVNSIFANERITTTLLKGQDDAASNITLGTGSLILSSSEYVNIADVLNLNVRATNPSNPPSGSLMVSSSGGVSIKPWFWDGQVWTALY